MLALRLLTAAALLAGFITAVLRFDRFEFSILVGGILALAAYEWGKLCGFPARRAVGYAGALLALYAVLTGLWFPLSVRHAPETIVFGLAVAYWVTLVPYWLRRGFAHPALVSALAGPATLLPCALAMAALPGGELLFALALVWVADTAAYLAGRWAGTRKLAPAVSPGKTWEGAAGALLGTLTYAIACALLVSWLQGTVRGVRWSWYLAGIGVLCVLSILGDLFESAIKRRANVKDSGSLLPGHGGVLDRIDSVTASLPGAALLLKAMGLG